LSCPPMAVKVQGETRAVDFLLSVCNAWFDSVPRAITFLFLAVGTGMMIHGLQWTVLAWLEKHKDPQNLQAAHRMFYHAKFPVVLQILLGPFIMICEFGWILATCRDLDRLLMEENAPFLNPEDMPVFNFLQEFYLHFAQFYAHTAYALLVSVPCMAATWSILGYTPNRWILVAGLYLSAGAFFILGRVQLGSLFSAEWDLRKPSSKDEDGSEKSEERP